MSSTIQQPSGEDAVVTSPPDDTEKAGKREKLILEIEAKIGRLTHEIGHANVAVANYHCKAEATRNAARKLLEKIFVLRKEARFQRGLTKRRQAGASFAADAAIIAGLSTGKDLQ